MAWWLISQNSQDPQNHGPTWRDGVHDKHLAHFKKSLSTFISYPLSSLSTPFPFSNLGFWVGDSSAFRSWKVASSSSHRGTDSCSPFSRSRVFVSPFSDSSLNFVDLLAGHAISPRIFWSGSICCFSSWFLSLFIRIECFYDLRYKISGISGCDLFDFFV